MFSSLFSGPTYHTDVVKKNTVKGKTWNSNYESLSGTLDNLSFIISFSLSHPFRSSNILSPSLTSKEGQNKRCLLWDFSYHTYRKSSFWNSQEIVIYTAGSSSSTQQFSATIKMCKATRRNAETAFISGNPRMKKQCSACCPPLLHFPSHRKFNHTLTCYTTLHAH